MNCPQCNSPMKKGKFGLYGTLEDMTIFQRYGKNLYFLFDAKDFLILEGEEHKEGYWCGNCDLSIILPQIINQNLADPKDLFPERKCKHCGNLNYIGGNNCTDCGKPL